MLQTGNREYSAEQIARDREARLFGNPLINIALAALGISAIRYDQAQKGRRLSPAEIHF
jgi:hypothetical protein